MDEQKSQQATGWLRLTVGAEVAGLLALLLPVIGYVTRLLSFSFSGDMPFDARVLSAVSVLELASISVFPTALIAGTGGFAWWLLNRGAPVWNLPAKVRGLTGSLIVISAATLIVAGPWWPTSASVIGGLVSGALTARASRRAERQRRDSIAAAVAREGKLVEAGRALTNSPVLTAVGSVSIIAMLLGALAPGVASSVGRYEFTEARLVSGYYAHLGTVRSHTFLSPCEASYYGTEHMILELPTDIIAHAEFERQPDTGASLYRVLRHGEPLAVGAKYSCFAASR